MKVVVLGAKGYVGKHFCRILETKGEKYFALDSQQCNLLELDSTRNVLTDLADDALGIVVFSVVNKGARNSIDSFLDNIKMISNFIESIRDLPVQRIVYAGAADVYGSKPTIPIDENAPVDPVCHYSLAKYTVEQMLFLENFLENKVASIRLPGIYGRDDREQSIVGMFVHRIKEGKKIQLHGGGSAKRDFVFVDDVCNMFYTVLRSNYCGVLNFATGKSFSMREIVDIIERVLGFKAFVESTKNGGDRNFDLVFDISLLKDAFPDMKTTDLESGISCYKY